MIIHPIKWLFHFIPYAPVCRKYQIKQIQHKQPVIFLYVMLSIARAIRSTTCNNPLLSIKKSLQKHYIQWVARKQEGKWSNCLILHSVSRNTKAPRHTTSVYFTIQFYAILISHSNLLQDHPQCLIRYIKQYWEQEWSDDGWSTNWWKCQVQTQSIQ